MSMKFLLLCLTSLWALAACQSSGFSEQGAASSSSSGQQITAPSAEKSDETVETAQSSHEIVEQGNLEETDTTEEQADVVDAVQSEEMAETFSQLSAGDLSSLVGTWQNAAGGSLVVTETGFEGMEVTSSGQAEDTFYFTVMMDGAPNGAAGGGGLVYIPAGVSYGSLEDSAGMTDYSDTSRDRFIMGHIITPSIPESMTDWVYYRQN